MRDEPLANTRVGRGELLKHATKGIWVEKRRGVSVCEKLTPHPPALVV